MGDNTGGARWPALDQRLWPPQLGSLRALGDRGRAAAGRGAAAAGGRDPVGQAGYPCHAGVLVGRPRGCMAQAVGQRGRCRRRCCRRRCCRCHHRCSGRSRQRCWCRWRCWFCACWLSRSLQAGPWRGGRWMSGVKLGRVGCPVQHCRTCDAHPTLLSTPKPQPLAAGAHRRGGRLLHQHGGERTKGRQLLLLLRRWLLRRRLLASIGGCVCRRRRRLRCNHCRHSGCSGLGIRHLHVALPGRCGWLVRRSTPCHSGSRAGDRSCSRGSSCGVRGLAGSSGLVCYRRHGVLLLQHVGLDLQVGLIRRCLTVSQGRCVLGTCTCWSTAMPCRQHAQAYHSKCITHNRLGQHKETPR